ncbi:hypothetical protein IWZ01DRAFT_244622 [Phyllosticta capitalensis]
MEMRRCRGDAVHLRTTTMTVTMLLPLLSLCLCLPHPPPTTASTRICRSAHQQSRSADSERPDQHHHAKSPPTTPPLPPVIADPSIRPARPGLVAHS